MDEIRISLNATDDPGGVAVVRVDGVVDTMTAGELENVMNSLIDQRRYNIIVDLGGVDYISSAGWGIFISNIREIRQNRGDIKLAQMIPSVEKARLDFRHAAPQGSGDAIAVLQAPPPDSTPALQRKSAVDSPRVQESWTVESALKDICIRDPFLSTSDIRGALEAPPYSQKLSWWGTWRNLRSLGLGSKRRRFELSRRSKG